MDQIIVKPFIKWVGGKKQLLPEIRRKYPKAFTKYCEPFVGGGAVLFDILQAYDVEEVLINDINPELINLYLQIKSNPELLIQYLSIMQEDYIKANDDDKKQLFLQKRDKFNTLIGNNINNVEKAALFIFLNKTCFNGLYRVNSKGLFNVPFNRAKNPLLCDKENILACSSLLKNVQMISGDYKQTINL